MYVYYVHKDQINYTLKASKPSQLFPDVLQVYFCLLTHVRLNKKSLKAKLL